MAASELKKKQAAHPPTPPGGAEVRMSDKDEKSKIRDIKLCNTGILKPFKDFKVTT